MSAFVNTLRAVPELWNSAGLDAMTVRVQLAGRVGGGGGALRRAYADGRGKGRRPRRTGCGGRSRRRFRAETAGVGVSDESLSLADGGARDGLTFVLMRRRRRAVH